MSQECDDSFHVSVDSFYHYKYYWSNVCLIAAPELTTMRTELVIKPDKDCFVRPLGVNDYYVCRSKDRYRNNCPYLKDSCFCNFPNQQDLPEG
jgi:hypothetical protein